jgi:hypothetical protein
MIFEALRKLTAAGNRFKETTALRPAEKLGKISSIPKESDSISRKFNPVS